MATMAPPRPLSPMDPESERAALTRLLEAGVHFGHQKKRWNPKMKPYIFTERNGIHIIDLQQTVRLLDQAKAAVADATRRGGKILFVGTKKQAQDTVKKEADRSGQLFVNQRWLGGTLTNFITIRSRLRHMRTLEGQVGTSEFELLPKVEQTRQGHELDKLHRMLGGLREMDRLPAIVFIVDPKREQNAVAEAMRLKIPIMAMVDTNCDPDQIDYVIPANDDGIRAVRVIVGMIADAALEGRGISGAEGLNYEEMLDVPPAVDGPLDQVEDFSETGTGDGAGQLTGPQGMTPGGATGS
ncbi:MAG: SSU ribosomal protein S2p (SAe) [uncultured Thermomicrobiales bacterium]|uniref:Small ribosomal subunit protein uS2 n=1 Tax=uncultured Thermomicrobiales bacterium TaxID=1645740 RepID=A0A6J4UZH4_9BACT|nr:MAG: SSU ribosomal protein S2p (SAe) [uncultured Thermomicrobiales bacterium]